MHDGDTVHSFGLRSSRPNGQTQVIGQLIDLDPDLLLSVPWRVAYSSLIAFRTYPTYSATYFETYLHRVDLA